GSAPSLVRVLSVGLFWKRGVGCRSLHLCSAAHQNPAVWQRSSRCEQTVETCAGQTRAIHSQAQSKPRINMNLPRPLASSLADLLRCGFRLDVDARFRLLGAGHMRILWSPEYH